MLWQTNTKILKVFKFHPKPQKLSVGVKSTAEIRGSLTSWSSPWREAKLNLPLCMHSPDLASSHRHFSMVATCLRSDVCHLQAPQQMGAQGEARA